MFAPVAARAFAIGLVSNIRRLRADNIDRFSVYKCYSGSALSCFQQPPPHSSLVLRRSPSRFFPFRRSASPDVPQPPVFKQRLQPTRIAPGRYSDCRRKSGCLRGRKQQNAKFRWKEQPFTAKLAKEDRCVSLQLRIHAFSRRPKGETKCIVLLQLSCAY